MKLDDTVMVQFFGELIESYRQQIMDQEEARELSKKEKKFLADLRKELELSNPQAYRMVTELFVTLDLESSGEHFGTIFMTPGGMMEQGSSFLSEKQKQALAEYYIPYDYWYTPLVERDHHVDFTQMPEEVADIRRMVDELLVQGEAFHMNEPK